MKIVVAYFFEMLVAVYYTVSKINRRPLIFKNCKCFENKLRGNMHRTQVGPKCVGNNYKRWRGTQVT